ncbi:hypothetical protein KQX54_021719 [Cotesia glomerata]|uniref:Uncharacterized protein n=1 Tax=Cotesia glomerata TaxID=32391 RepID=A0AAV7IWS1_COTGL|nr:hypothetical protein KQX54_021719 [Cotesia glomerata]
MHARRYGTRSASLDSLESRIGLVSRDRETDVETENTKESKESKEENKELKEEISIPCALCWKQSQRSGGLYSIAKANHVHDRERHQQTGMLRPTDPKAISIMPRAKNSSYFVSAVPSLSISGIPTTTITSPGLGLHLIVI